MPTVCPDCKYTDWYNTGKCYCTEGPDWIDPNEIVETIKEKKLELEIREFRDGAIVISCVNGDQDNDLVFTGGRMRPDPRLEEQRKIAEYIVKAVNAYEEK